MLSSLACAEPTLYFKFGMKWVLLVMKVVTVVMIGARDMMAVQLYAFIGTEINATLNYQFQVQGYTFYQQQ